MPSSSTAPAFPCELHAARARQRRGAPGPRPGEELGCSHAAGRGSHAWAAGGAGGPFAARARTKGQPELGRAHGRKDGRRAAGGTAVASARRVAPRLEGPRQPAAARRGQEERGQSAGAPAAGLAPAQLRVHSVNSSVRGARAPRRAAPIAPAFLFHMCESRVRRRCVPV